MEYLLDSDTSWYTNDTLEPNATSHTIDMMKTCQKSTEHLQDNTGITSSEHAEVDMDGYPQTKPFTCFRPDCGKSFNSERGLMRHVKVHHVRSYRIQKVLETHGVKTACETCSRPYNSLHIKKTYEKFKKNSKIFHEDAHSVNTTAHHKDAHKDPTVNHKDAHKNSTFNHKDAH